MSRTTTEKKKSKKIVSKRVLKCVVFLVKMVSRVVVT